MAGAESQRRDGAEWQEALCLEAVSKGGLPGKELTIAPCFWEVVSQPSQEPSICLGDWSLRSVSHACVMEPQEELCPEPVKAEFNLDPFSAVN